jgi:methyltransferase (TIGR00027 family)
MNEATPSRTSQAVALTRAEFDRPHSAEGDPGAQRALCAGMEVTPPSWLVPGIAARTRFIDDRVIEAIASGLRQVVICGAGYDDRALRFRTAGVRFFELDHPDTQADKERRLHALRGAGPGPVLAAADFRADDAAVVLERCGHDGSQPSLFICEGLLVYLPPEECRRLLTGLSLRAPVGSVLAVSLATHSGGVDSAEVLAAANARRRTGAAEPWQTILPAAEHMALLEAAGWRVCSIADSPVPAETVSHGRRSLLVTATPLQAA